MSPIRLSIIVPAYNREATIGSALQSIGRTLPDSCEIIVVDDGSTDQTALQAARALRAMDADQSRIIRQTGAGPGAARNAGVAQAKGDYLAFLDSDDLWSDQTLTAILSAIDQVPSAALLFLQSVDFTGEFPQPQPPKPHAIALFDGFIEATRSRVDTRFASCNVVIPKSVLEAASGFDETLPCSEDTDLFLRVAQNAGTAVIYGDPMVGHRVDTSDRLSCDAPKVAQGFEAMIRKDQEGGYGSVESYNRQAFLAGSAVYTARVAFSHGHLGLAYKILFKYLGLILPWKTRWVWRLALTPILAQMRPRSYPFQWASDTAPRGWVGRLRKASFSRKRVSQSEHWPVG
jgi:glycosyltransferase involved in cell wall biosynthesis